MEIDPDKPLSGSALANYLEWPAYRRQADMAMGFPVVANESVPDNEIQFRDRDGKIVGRIKL